MNTSASKANLAIIAAVALSLTATVCLVLCDDATWLHPDTAQALSVARNVMHGRGFSTSVIYYEEHYQLEQWPAPQTVFPVGFPAMIAALASVGVPLRTAAWSIGVTGFLLVPPLICLSALRMGCGFRGSLLSAALWLCFPMVWHNVWERQTEMMFIALTLSSAILLQIEAPTNRRLLLAGLCAAIAFSLRYAGIFWLVAAGLIFAAQFWRNPSNTFRRCAAFFVVPLTLAVSMFARNALLVGDIKGGNNKDVDKTLRDGIEAAYYAISRVTGLDASGLADFQLAETLVALGFGLLLVVSLLWSIRRRRVDLSATTVFRTPGDAAIALYVVVSLAALIVLEKSTSINLSPRMILPIIPFAFLAAADWVGRLTVAFAKTSVNSRRVVAIASALIIAGLLEGQSRAASDVQSQVRRFGMVNDIVDRPIQCDLGLVTPRELLLEMKILTDESHMLAESLQQGTVGLTSSVYTNRVWTDDEVRALIRRYQINRVVVFPGVLPKEGNPFLGKLMHRAEAVDSLPAWLEPIVVTPQIQIYGVLDSIHITHNH